MIQSTAGISRPLAATLVQSNVPCVAFVNSKNVRVRFSCFCFPYTKSDGMSRAGREYVKIQDGDVDEIE